MQRRFVRTFTFMPVSVCEMVFTLSSGILGIKRSTAVRAVAGTFCAFGNIIDVNEGFAFIQRIGQECAHD
ncbi:MAG: hypothetical protein MR722_01170 [Bacteroidales bacterium]|nr:hypothetical protein [Bacteroidales bacterium]